MLLLVMLYKQTSYDWMQTYYEILLEFSITFSSQNVFYSLYFQWIFSAMFTQIS